MGRHEPRHAARFDDQAPGFDGRAGLPSLERARIAEAIVAIAGLGAVSRVLDVGAGTGEITGELLARGVSCVAVDESPAMLAEFRRKAHSLGVTPELVTADARLRWPIDDGSVNLVFGSRSLHWLPADHVRAEGFRVASPRGCTLLVGRVTRDDEGPRARIRRKMRELLRAAGYPGRSGEKSARDIVERCIAHGATPLSTFVAASWTVRVAPRSILDAWRQKSGLGGSDVPGAVKEDVLARTGEWVEATFGDIDVPVESEECYTLEGVTLVPRGRDSG
jgi:ubiquinone/menaquinone biosynthesis C-methylase UbiE